MSEEADVMNEITGKNDSQQQQTGNQQTTTKKSKEDKDEDALNDKIKEKQREKEEQKKQEEQINKLAEAKNTIKSLKVEDIVNDDVQIEFQSVLDMREELGDVKVAEKLERLSVYDKAMSMLAKASENGIDDDFIEMLKEITENKKGFDIAVAGTTLKAVSKVMEKAAVKNVNEIVDVDLSIRGKNMKNSVYFVEEAKQRQAKKEKEALSFFLQNRG